ncbi:amino acid/polyamine transporter I [Xylariales sp. PMI_506]|nr:amino acid/polyamine transporter I [Xylariales sp. PMI_506]
MSLWETISASWIICNSWAGIAATIALAISLGGPTVLIYGPIAMFILVGCCAATLAELASVYPTAGGQYHWTSILAPKTMSKQLSYACGFINACSWVTICAGIAIIAPQLCLAMAVFFHPDYVPQAWHTFLIYQGINFLVLLYNIFLLKHTLWIHSFAFFLSIFSFLAITITCLARASSFQTSEFVWKTFINESGWSSDGVAFLIGLVSPNYMYAGIDGALHLAEECKNAAVVVPRALMSTITIGFITSFIFMIAMIYSAQDFDAVISTATGVPIYELWYQASASDAAATVFLVLLLLAVIFALNGAQQTASRLTWSFARDNAIWGSGYFDKMHPTLDVPVWTLVLNFAIMFVIGCIYLGSSSTFNAIIGCGLTLQHITYAIPAALVMYRRRSEKVLPTHRSFRMPRVVGYVANSVTVFMALFTVIFYNLPVTMPATGANMNYAVAVLAVMAIFGFSNWFIHAKYHYHGPRLETMDA